MTIEADLSRSTTESSTWARRRSWVRRSWVPLLLVFASLLVGGVVTASHTKSFSPYDEWVYYDYVTKIPTEGVVREGENIGKPALAAMSCYGDTYGPRGDPCGGPYNNPSAYPQAGKTSADLYTPLYFAVTWAVARGVQFVSGLDLLTAARYAGLLWLSAGIWVFARALRKLRVPEFITLGVGLLVVVAPSMMFANTYISTDAPAFLVGSVLLLFAVRVIRGEMSGWWLLVPGVVGILLKVANIVGIGAAFLVLVIYALSKWRTAPAVRGPSPRKLIAYAFAMVAASVVAEFVWLAIRTMIKVGPQPDQGVAGKLDLRGLGGLVTVFFPGAFGNASNPLSIPSAVFAPIGWLLIAGVIGYLFQSRSWGVRRAIGISTSIGVVFFAPMLLIAMFFALGAVPPIADRYAISLVPFMLVCTAQILRNRIGRWGIVGYGACVALGVIFYSIRLIVIHA